MKCPKEYLPSQSRLSNEHQDYVSPLSKKKIIPTSKFLVLKTPVNSQTGEKGQQTYNYPVDESRYTVSINI